MIKKMPKQDLSQLMIGVPKINVSVQTLFHKTDEFTVKFLTFYVQWFILSFNLTNLNFYRIRKKEKNFLRCPSTYALKKS